MKEYKRICRWEQNIKMEPKEISEDVSNWIELANVTDRWKVLVNTALNLGIAVINWTKLAQVRDHWKILAKNSNEPTGYTSHKIVSIPISSQLSYVILENIRNNTGSFVDERTMLSNVKK